MKRVVDSLFLAPDKFITKVTNVTTQTNMNTYSQP
jgi:hypothetical protein